jgi:membrane protease subunit HflK
MGRDRVSHAAKKALSQLCFIYLKRLLLVLFGAYLLSGIYKIDKDSVGVVTRYGAIRHRAIPPGLHYKMPWPIDTVHRVAVKQVKTLRISDFFKDKTKKSHSARGNGFFSDTDIDPYCITGDNNIVAVKLLLKYTVSDPVKYLFNHKKSDALMERAAASTVFHMLAQRKVDEVLTFGKKQIELEMLKALRSQIGRLETGISITFLEIESISPPEKVEDAFNQVINAKVNKKKVLNEAQGYYNRVVPRARSSADQIVQDALAYKHERVLKAQGDASRFLSRLDGYRQDPVTGRRKIYQAFIQSLYPNLKEIRVVDGNGTNNGFAFPLPQASAK